MTERLLRFAELARLDLQGVATWTEAQFGPLQADRYAAMLDTGILDLAVVPEPWNSRDVGHIRPGLRILRLVRLRHVVLYSLPDTDSVLIMRILHAAMDPTRHLGPSEDPPPG